MSKTIIITGAGSGIGAATARTFLDEGFQVGLIGRHAKTLEGTARGNKNALVLPCDVSNPDSVERVFAVAKKKWGRLDVLFNNAGIGSFSNTIDEIPIQNLIITNKPSPEGWADVIKMALVKINKN